VVELTVSVTVQDPLLAIVPPDRLRLPPLKLAVPPQVVAAFDPLRFVGNGEAATATPVSWVDAFGLVMVSVSVELPPSAIVAGLNAAAMVGTDGGFTVSVFVVAVLPVRLEGPVAETAPVV
jgi:hypothetical protein